MHAFQSESRQLVSTCSTYHLLTRQRDEQAWEEIAALRRFPLAWLSATGVGVGPPDWLLTDALIAPQMTPNLTSDMMDQPPYGRLRIASALSSRVPRPTHAGATCTTVAEWQQTASE